MHTQTTTKDFGIEPLLVPIPIAAEMLGVRRSTIYRLLDDGRLRASKLGARRLVSVASIRDLVAKLAED